MFKNIIRVVVVVAIILLPVLLILSCGKPLVRGSSAILPVPTVILSTASVADSTDTHDSVITVIEYRHDTTNDCDSVFTTTAKVQRSTVVSRKRDTVRVPVNIPYAVRDTIYHTQNVIVPYNPWKIIGWLGLGLVIGGIVGFTVCAVMFVGKR
jgi:hypothetical protein